MSSSAHQISEVHRFELLIDALSDHAIYMLDQDGFIASWNAGAERIKGYRPAEIVGKHLSRFFTTGDQASRIPEKILAEARAAGVMRPKVGACAKMGPAFGRMSSSLRCGMIKVI